MNTKQFVTRYKIRCTADYLDRNPSMEDFEGVHYKVTLKMGRKQLTVPFSMGYGLSGEPEPADVLDCLASDACGYENSRSFEEWASEYGYDTDSRKAEKIYHAVKRQTEKLHQFIGDKFDDLIWNTERL